jgi:hypothetical protein
MRQLFYQIIYNSEINFILRSINKLLLKIFDFGIKIPPAGIIKIHINSKSVKIKTNQTNFVSHLLYWNGYKNFEYTSIFLSLVNKIDCFYDVGANIGFYSLIASARNPNIRIISFEPARGPLYYLIENVKLNNFENIIIEDIALSQDNGSITFYEPINNKYSYLE